MKKNSLLYFLLIFLVIANGFFLYNYLGKSKHKRPKGERKNFIVKKLDFDETQIAEFNKLQQGHRESIRKISQDLRNLKDDMFNNISNQDFTASDLDSITNLIASKEKEKDIEVFYHFQAIEAICNDEQKEKFKTIIKEAMHKGNRRQHSSKRGLKEGPPERRH